MSQVTVIECDNCEGQFDFKHGVKFEEAEYLGIPVTKDTMMHLCIECAKKLTVFEFMAMIAVPKVRELRETK